MIVKISELPIDIQNQIPLSIRIQNEVELNSLPYKLREIIEEYLEGKKSVNTNTNSVYDAILDKGAYDLKYVNDLKEAVKNFIANYFTIRRGTYPFDPNFGTTIYQYLQSRSFDIIPDVINSELAEIITQLRIDLGVDNIKIASISVDDTEVYHSNVILVNITVEVQENPIAIKLNLPTTTTG